MIHASEVAFLFYISITIQQVFATVPEPGKTEPHAAGTPENKEDPCPHFPEMNKIWSKSDVQAVHAMEQGPEITDRRSIGCFEKMRVYASYLTDSKGWTTLPGTSDTEFGNKKKCYDDFRGKLSIQSFILCYAVIENGTDEITHLPGWDSKLSSRHFSGYLKASKTHFLHYWLVESQSNPDSDPLIFWFNGGPGCSSIMGLLYEMGPYRPSDDGKILKVNPNAWNRFSNATIRTMTLQQMRITQLLRTSFKGILAFATIPYI
ncbi:serine carboxypeptidase domain-containing protein [Ditylenchus destructor]|uniref:Serine carboxypeptidase domain-containing protein n=1 Tax=Ditylenchus destructor TaxID=166010 RepID=A0AAD4MW60_9BILA|nr:serine carboxypeptidase domain-containing protein [Ditylenchus destructor]